jgi:hypothetical protein
MTMLYALERESNLGSTFAVFVELSEGRDVSSGPVSRNNSGDISWHKTRIFISEVFRFEELALELTTPGFYRVYFRELEVGELNAEELRFRAARRVV